MNFYVTGVAETSANFLAVKLGGPNYLKCSKINDYGANYQSTDIVIYDFDITYVCYTPLLATEVNVDNKSPTLLAVQTLTSEVAYVKICIPGSCW